MQGKEHRLNPEESDRIVMKERLAVYAEEVFGDKDKAHAWLRTHNRALDNQIPFDLFHSEVGTRIVETLLGRIEYGVYS